MRRATAADDADLMIRLFWRRATRRHSSGPYFDVIVPAADIPANEWVRLELPVDTSVDGGSNWDDHEHYDDPSGRGVLGDRGFDMPTPVETQSIYIDNLYFSNGNPAPEQTEPPFVLPSGLRSTSRPRTCRTSRSLNSMAPRPSSSRRTATTR